MQFEVVEPVAGNAQRLEPVQEKVVGKAQPVNVGEMDSDFTVVWAPEVQAHPPSGVWVREAAGL
jgi:hypothetical protein